MYEKLCFCVQNMLHMYRNYFINRFCSVDSVIIFITSVICCRNSVGIVLVYVKLCVESGSLLSSSQKFMCVCVFYVCDSKSSSSSSSNNNNSILGLEICAVAKEAL